MKKYFFMFISLLVMIITASILYAINKPQIVFEKKMHDFGTVKEGEILEYNFVFKNNGDGVLKISDIDTSCGCTAAQIGSKKVFKKGEQGKIKVQYSTKNREGKIEQFIIIHSNDVKNPESYLIIRCEIKP